MKQARWKDGKFDLWSGIDPDTVEGRFMTRNEKVSRVSEERKGAARADPARRHRRRTEP